MGDFKANYTQKFFSRIHVIKHFTTISYQFYDTSANFFLYLNLSLADFMPENESNYTSI